jgi:hypothetical protein
VPNLAFYMPSPPPQITTRMSFASTPNLSTATRFFLTGFHFRKVTLSQSGQVGFIVEFSGEGFCGSTGCAINVLKQSGDKRERTFENDEVGQLDSFELAPTISNGFYDLTKHGKDGTDYYS